MAVVTLQDSHNSNFYYEFNPKDECSVLGKGGMGIVFKGKRINNDSGKFEAVAIKVLFNDLDEDSIERARREASIKIKHENLLQMYDFIELSDSYGKTIYYVISEFLEGETLNESLKQKQHFDWKESLRIIKNILAGLYMLHEKGYLHRDIDPSNIIICNDGKIKIIDFGIAKELFNSEKFRQKTIEGKFIGKVFYASPEQINGNTKLLVKPTVDIYSAGIILFELLTGKLPYTGTTYEILKGHLEKQIPVEQISLTTGNVQEIGSLIYLIKKSTEKNQSERYQSSTEFMLDIERVLNGQKLIPPKPRVWYYIAALCVILIGIGIWQYHEIIHKRYDENIDLAQKYLSTALYKEALEKYKDAYSIYKTDSVKSQIEILEILCPAIKAFTFSDYEVADSLFREALKLNSPDAFYYLGEMSYDGIGIPKNIQQAIGFTQQAAELGNGLAFYRMGVIYREGLDTITKNEDKAIKYFDDARKLIIDPGDNAKNPELLNIKGDMYLRGLGVTQNLNKAKEYYTEAAIQNYPLAQFNLYELLKKTDMKKAFEFLEKSANSGYPKAQFELGHYFLTNKDYVNYYSWIYKAANKKYAPALRDMGAIYQEISSDKKGNELVGVLESILTATDVISNDSISLYFLKEAVNYDPYFENGLYALALQEFKQAVRFKKKGEKQKSLEFLQSAKENIKNVNSGNSELAHNRKIILTTEYNDL